MEPKEIKRKIAEAIAKNRCIILSDYDGTVAPLVSNAAQAFPEPEFLHFIHNLPKAVLFFFHTGRPIAQFDSLIHGVEHDADKPALLDDPRIKTYFNVIGQHGAEFRYQEEEQEPLCSIPFEEIALLKQFTIRAKRFAVLIQEQLLLEKVKIDLENIFEVKSQSFAFHWRTLEPLISEEKLIKIQSDIKNFLDSLIAIDTETYEVLNGKMNFEFKSRRVNKGIALKTLLTKRLKFSYKAETSTFFASTPIDERPLLLWLCDDLRGTDGSAAEMIHEFGGLVLQVESGEKPFPDELQASPDLRFESPKALAQFLQETLALANQYTASSAFELTH